MCWLAVLIASILSACAGVVLMAAMSASGWDDGWRSGYAAGRADESAGLPPPGADDGRDA